VAAFRTTVSTTPAHSDGGREDAPDARNVEATGWRAGFRTGSTRAGPSVVTVPTLPPTVVLAEDTLKVEPGSRVQTTVKISNRSDIVEGFRLEVLGEGLREWAEVTPAELQIYPGQEGIAVVAMMPPSGSAAQSGTYPFAVRVQSVSAETTTIAEGDLEVGKVFGLNHKITPVTSEGRWRGRHLVTLTNWGNSATQLTVTAADPDEKLAFLVVPDKLDLPVGRSASTRVQVRTRHPFLRGTKTRLPFQVVAEPDAASAPPPTAFSRLPGLDQRKVTIDAGFTQKPILSRFIVILVPLLLLAGGGGVAWALSSSGNTSDTGRASSPPESPVLTVSPVSSNIISVGWLDQTGIQGYTVFQKDPGGAYAEVQKVDQAGYRAANLTPASNYCFRVEARRAGFRITSEEKCADTPALPSSVGPDGTSNQNPDGTTQPGPGGTTQPGPGGTTPPGPGGSTPPNPSGSVTTPTGTTGPTTTGGGPGVITFPSGEFISVVRILSADALDPAIAQELVKADEKLAAVGKKTSALRTRDYSKLLLNDKRPDEDVILIYVPGFSSKAQAIAFCAGENGRPKLALSECVAAQPQPNAGAASTP
jgi:hypothetical protein